MTASDFARELIAFPSVSRASNVAVSEYVRDQLLELGFETEWVEYRDPAGVVKANVVARRGEGSGGWAYFAHTDVVPADDWGIDQHGPFEPTVSGERLYGRGSCDMKGSLACALASAAFTQSEKLRAPLYFVVTADEEVGFIGAEEVRNKSQLYRELVEAQPAAIIGEPTELQIVHAHKGSCLIRATARGEAAHSSSAAGRNANHDLIPFLQQMKQLHDETETDARWHDERFDPPTLSWNIGIRDHNHAINVKSPQSECLIYLRPIPGLDIAPLLERVREAGRESGVEIEIKSRGDGLSVAPDHPYIRELLELANGDRAQTVCYGTDGAIFGEDLERIAVCGPGSIAQAHTKDEWIALLQLDAGTELFANLITRYCINC
ncbi:M20 family metallopeptidase [Stratiformator vulcanicus]|uniref:Acetylornithine deacetylase n=1 Tax=Stratiformator vulcanicus TaxID=2527980 RepID=A0A517R0P1_9PLAN|nr:M20 family metallopeptidase [Stratiformator vulcanicus]QDT37404.1 Acetylornithine deacetylase [Stratiformator vulcanicus]